MPMGYGYHNGEYMTVIPYAPTRDRDPLSFFQAIILSTKAIYYPVSRSEKKIKTETTETEYKHTHAHQKL
jgi:hypothetical protein